jgi:hypothetical protein
MDFKPQDLKTIKEFAHKKVLDNAVDRKHENLFMAKCWTEAVLTFLNSKGYDVMNEEMKKAIENLAHAVSACNYAEGTYLLEAAQELVELVYPKK